MNRYLHTKNGREKIYSDGVKHGMDKSFIIFKSLFYTFTPIFYRTRTFAQTCRCTEFADTPGRMNEYFVHIQLAENEITRPLNITHEWY